MAEYTVKEKMEHAIAEAAASFMTNEYVVKGAQLKCTLGSAPSLLNLPLCHGFYATGHPIIHSMDNKPMVNILPFGTCPVLGGPCVPAPVGPWLNTHEKTMIADAAPGGPLYPAVTMKSFLVCALGGLIEPKKSGQEYKAPGSSSTLTAQVENGMTQIKDEEIPLALKPSTTANTIQSSSNNTQSQSLIEIPPLLDIPEIEPPDSNLQSKTWWCYAAIAYMMCQDNLSDDAKKYLKSEMENFNNLLQDFVTNGTDPKKSGLNKYCYTTRPDGSWSQSSVTGLREIAAGSVTSSVTGQTLYFADPIQQFIVDKITTLHEQKRKLENDAKNFIPGPKNNYGMSIYDAIQFLTNKTFDWSPVNTALAPEKAAQKILDELQNGPVIVNVRDSNGTGHSLLLKQEYNMYAKATRV